MAVEDENGVVIEGGPQPLPDALFGPVLIEFNADILDRGLRNSDTADFTQHALAVVAQRAREQLLLMPHGDFIGALGGGEHGDDDADDRHGNDRPDRDHDAQARAIPTGWLPLFGSARSNHSRQGLVP